MSRRVRPHTLLTTGAAVAAALVLTACGGDDGGTTTVVQAAPETVTVAARAPATTAATTASTPATTTEQRRAATTSRAGAARIARDRYPGESRIGAVRADDDDDRPTWEVRLRTAAGAERTVTVEQAGGRIVEVDVDRPDRDDLDD